MTTIAFLGLGRMGTLMAGRVLLAGHDLIVWNRTPGREQPLVAEGARAAPTPAEAAREAEIVITMLAGPPALEAVALGPDGIAGAIAPTACLVEMSTVGPQAALAVAGRLPAGTGFVDAPVMGSVGPARSGELTVLAGGDVDRVEKVLAIFGTVVRCGAAGSGAARKLVLISAALAGVTLVGEVLALAAALGVPRDAALQGLAAGPLAGSLGRVQSTSSDFAIALAAKDLTLATGAAGLPQLAAAREWLRAAAAEGAADQDLGRVVEHIHPPGAGAGPRR
ncbi:MAG TPA: NAD(P)-dependent oxidoreductase [Streptosporangiaceae bacterium]|nr:NAD(P)-dependent oxidoreductase [Streptosporangiaceae bacterium]